MHRFFARNSKKSKIWLWWFILWKEWLFKFSKCRETLSRRCAVVIMSIKGNRSIVVQHCFCLCFQFIRSPPKRRMNFAINFSLCDHITQSSIFINFPIPFTSSVQSNPLSMSRLSRLSKLSKLSKLKGSSSQLPASLLWCFSLPKSSRWSEVSQA